MGLPSGAGGQVFCPGCARPMATCVMTVSISTLLTGRCGRNCLYLSWLGNKSLAKRSFRKGGACQIHVAALISQRLHLQYLTTNVFLIAPAKRVEILHLSTLYGHACFSLSCPCGRTMFECILVFVYSRCGIFLGVSGVTY